jgi:hypothetical protein
VATQQTGKTGKQHEVNPCSVVTELCPEENLQLVKPQVVYHMFHGSKN